MQQDSKQVQVDLQDMGYETCGRSENEAEREDTSSPGLPHSSSNQVNLHANLTSKVYYSKCFLGVCY